MMHQSLHGMNQQAAVMPSLKDGKAPIKRPVSGQSLLTSVSVSEHALFPSMAEHSTYNTADSVRRASAPPEFMGHQLLPGVNQLAAVSHQHTVSAVRSVYNTADSFLNMLSTSSLNGMNTEALIEAADSFLNTLSTSSLHGMNTVAAYGFNDVAREELKQAPNRNESSSPCDEFLQSIESSIGPLSPISKLFEGL
jgi:hypothetical protein